jgi:hypothetical protein
VSLSAPLGAKLRRSAAHLVKPRCDARRRRKPLAAILDQLTEQAVVVGADVFAGGLRAAAASLSLRFTSSLP